MSGKNDKTLILDVSLRVDFSAQKFISTNENAKAPHRGFLAMVKWA